MIVKSVRPVAAALLALCVTACQWWALTINVEFDQAAGLVPENRVIFAGQTAGVVKAVEPRSQGGVVARVWITKKFSSAATEYSRFYLVDDPDQSGRKAVEIRLSRGEGRVLANGVNVKGFRENRSWLDSLLNDLTQGGEVVRKHFEEMLEELRRLPESEEYQRLKKGLDQLGEELGRHEKEARTKLKRELLPRLEQELERLKKRLGGDEREQQLRNLEEQVEYIRGI